MRKFLMMAAAGLLAVPALATAEGGSGYEPGQKKDQAQIEQERQEQLGQVEQEGQFEEGAQVRTGMPQKMDAQAQKQLFQADSGKHWELEGTVGQINSQQRMITIQRENLPSAHVYVAEQSKIKLDGRDVSLNQLQPGSEVRAKFQLAQDTPILVELEAEKSKEQKKLEQQGTQPGGMNR